MAGSLNPKSSEMPIFFQKVTFVYTWAMGYLSVCNVLVAEVSFRVRYGAPKVRSLRNDRVKVYRRTPQMCFASTDLEYLLHVFNAHVAGLCVQLIFASNNLPLVLRLVMGR